MLFSVRQEVKDLSTMSEGREVGSSRTVNVQNGGGAECERLWPGMCTSIVARNVHKHSGRTAIGPGP